MSGASAPALVLCAVIAAQADEELFVDRGAQSGINFRHDSSPTSQKYLPEAE